MGVRPSPWEYCQWPVQRCLFSSISRKPATYLIHRGLKPSMIHAVNERVESWSKQQLNQSDSWSYEHTLASSLSPLVAVQISWYSWLPRTTASTQKLTTISPVVWQFAYSRMNLGVHFLTLIHQNFNCQYRIMTNFTKFLPAKISSYMYTVPSFTVSQAISFLYSSST